MARSGDDWDELTERTRQRKQTRRKRNRRQRSAEEQADHDYNEEHTSKFVSELEKKDSQYNWMKDDKNKRMFQKIEKRIQGAMGSGTYDWVDRRVFDQVFDRLTLMSLYKLMNAGVLDTLDFPVARGKEAHVFHGTDQQGKSVAVKIFHTSNAVFKNLMQYIEGDPRFGGLRRRHRDLVDIWVRKEHRNLMRLYRWGLPVPQPIAIQKNVLVMDYLGTESQPSPKLRDVKIDHPEAVYDEMLEFLAISWQKAELVHGDFSPFNILWHGNAPIVIDVGQGVVQHHPKAKEFLVRDVTRLVEWAKKNGLDVELADAMYDVLEMDLSHVVERTEEE